MLIILSYPIIRFFLSFYMFNDFYQPWFKRHNGRHTDVKLVISSKHWLKLVVESKMVKDGLRSALCTALLFIDKK